MSLIARAGFTALFLVLFGLGAWRQYVKFVDGRGIAGWLLPIGAPLPVQLFVFVGLPATAAFLAGWCVAREGR